MWWSVVVTTCMSLKRTIWAFLDAKLLVSGSRIIAKLGGRSYYYWQGFVEMERKGAMQAFGDCLIRDKEVLAQIVIELQKRNVSGTKGPWKAFLASVKKYGNDPFCHDPKVLASFLETITCEKGILMVKQIRSWIEQKRTIRDVLQTENRLPATPEQELVQLTRKHLRFKEDYDFKSYEEGWVHVDYDQSAPVNLLGLDCEMAECEGGIAEVVRVCLVDWKLTTLIDTLVRPSKKVLDYKSHITGVSADDLEAITITQTDAQSLVKESLVPGTIIVGHSVHNDLKALKIDYRTCIDTQFIFPVKGRHSFFCPGLRDLCKAVLGYDFREDNKPHDCLEDAKIPLRLVKHRLHHGPSLSEIHHKVDESLLSRLLLHKVPYLVANIDLQDLFPNFPCQMQDASKVGQVNTTYQTVYAVFKDKVDADNAFAQLRGLIETDITGRLQKKVFFRPKWHPRSKPKVTLMVRKMGFENDNKVLAATSKMKLESIETASKPSNLSGSVPAGVGSTKGVEETAKGIKMSKEANRNERLQQDNAEALVAEPLNLQVSIESQNGNKGGMDEAVEKLNEIKKAVNEIKKGKKRKKSPSEDIAVEPLRLSTVGNQAKVAMNEDTIGSQGKVSKVKKKKHSKRKHKFRK